MFVLALDPARTTGWAFFRYGLRRSGVWKFPKPQVPWLELYNTLHGFCQCEGYPDIIVYEGVANFCFRGKNSGEIAHKMRCAIDIFTIAESMTGSTIEAVKLKQWATGKGNAKKEKMIETARERFGYKGKSHDEADAILMREWQIEREGL